MRLIALKHDSERHRVNSMSDKKQEVAQKQEFNTRLSFYVNEYTGLMKRDFEENGVPFDDYSKQCVVNSMSAMYQLLHGKNLEPSDVNGSNLRDIIGKVASLKLNSNAVPRECYYTIKKQKVGNDYEQVIEMGIEGDGNDALLRNFGINIETVYPCWLVKEGDEFKFPRKIGIESTPPEWESKGLSDKVVRVVYPIKMKDGIIDYLISERSSVKLNLFAHIRNNMMNETFGICENRYKATPKQLDEIKAKKDEIFALLKTCETVEDMLACEKAIPFISAAWLETPESMIVRKMRNNAIKKYPKNFNTLANQSYLELDETYSAVQTEINENANTVDFDDMQAIDVDSKVVE